jgi:hypothetical protein
MGEGCLPWAAGLVALNTSTAAKMLQLCRKNIAGKSVNNLILVWHLLFPTSISLDYIISYQQYEKFFRFISSYCCDWNQKCNASDCCSPGFKELCRIGCNVSC